MGKTLLLADDSVTIQKVVGISFASEDIRLITVDNGDDAIARASEHRPDAILADVVMPGKNGYEVCAAIKADPALRHIPVLLLTGTFESFDEERARRCGAAGHVAKPFEAQALVERVRDLLAHPPAPTPEPVPAEDATPQVDALATPRRSAARPDDSFDFFDDDLEELAPPAGGRQAETPMDDGAFAFGEDEMDRPAAARATAQPASDRTVAILPEDDDARFSASATSLDVEVDAGAAPTQLDDAFVGAGESSGDLLAEAPGADLVSPAASEGFDFDFASEPPPARAASPIGDADLAGATVLDPKGSSGFDISSSDLGPPRGRPGRSLADSSPFGDPLDGDFTESTEPPAAPKPPPLRPAPEAAAPPQPLGPATPAAPARPRPTQALPPDAPRPFGAQPPAASKAAPATPKAPPAATPAAPKAPPAATPAAPKASPAATPAAPKAPPAAPKAPPAAPKAPPETPKPPPLPSLALHEEFPAQPAVSRGMPAAGFDDDAELAHEIDEFAAPAAMEDEPLHPRAALHARDAEDSDFAFGALEEDDDAQHPPLAATALDESSLEDLSEGEPLEAHVVGTHDPSALAGVALAEITPRLREQLHDTLEKVAWESFGDVAEQIVRQALERVEQIAWEVIPQMAETLIHEEIRRMKGEDDD